MRCEKLLNSLARKQKTSYALENSSPPCKRQKLLGVNKNNEVIVVDDQPSGPSHASTNKKPWSPVHRRQGSGNLGKAGTSCLLPALVPIPANGCIAGISAESKTQTVTAELREQRSRNPTDVPTEVICIDDDDDSVLVVNESPTAERCDSMPPTCARNNPPSPCNIPEAPKPIASAITQSLVCASTNSNTSSTDVCSGEKSSSEETAACITMDAAADNEQLPSTSEQASSSCFSVLSIDVSGQQAAASAQCLPRSKKVARLEKLLEVSSLP